MVQFVPAAIQAAAAIASALANRSAQGRALTAQERAARDARDAEEKRDRIEREQWLEQQQRAEMAYNNYMQNIWLPNYNSSRAAIGLPATTWTPLPPIGGEGQAGQQQPVATWPGGNPVGARRTGGTLGDLGGLASPDAVVETSATDPLTTPQAQPVPAQGTPMTPVGFDYYWGGQNNPYAPANPYSQANPFTLGQLGQIGSR